MQAASSYKPPPPVPAVVCSHHAAAAAAPAVPGRGPARGALDRGGGADCQGQALRDVRPGEGINEISTSAFYEYWPN